MGSMKSWMLGAAVVAGGMGLGAASAQAAEFGIYARGPVAYVPPCPGPGYFWVASYQSDGYWVPGRWEFRDGARWGHIARFEHGFREDRDRERGRDFDRREARERHDDRHRDRDRDRGRW